MITRILNRFGYVKRNQTVSLDDYMRLREMAQEQLDEYRKLRRVMLDNLSNIPVTLILPATPENVVSFKEWKMNK